MPSAWIERRTIGTRTRYRVRYRVGGAETRPLYAGVFATKREADTRRAWVLGELAAMRIPNLDLLQPEQAPLLRDIAGRWLASRVDASEASRLAQRSSIRLAVARLGDRRVDQITPDEVADLVVHLAARGKARGTIRKAVGALAMALDYAGVKDNPARDKVKVRLPRQDTPEIVPPTAEHVLAVHHLLPVRYRLPLLVLDATGMRLGELEQLTWGDIDEPRGRWRVSQTVSKTSRARWVSVPPVLFEAVLTLTAREDRSPARRVFQGFGGDRFRTAVTRATTAAGVPAFSPHALRHRRISLLHLAGVPAARIGEHVGQRDLKVTLNTYTHVIADEAEIDYAGLLERTGSVQ